MRSSGTSCSSEERQHSIIERIGSRDRMLAVIELHDGDLAVRIDKSLLVNPANALERANVVGIL